MKPEEISYKLRIDGQPILSFSDPAEAKRKALELLANAGGNVDLLVDYAGVARNEILRWDPSLDDWTRMDAMLTAAPSQT